MLGPWDEWQNLTLNGGSTSTFFDGITAPCVFDGPINGAKFLAYVEQVLAPTLSPGEIVVMDNSPLAPIKSQDQDEEFTN